MAIQHFRILAKQHGRLTIKPTFRQLVGGRAVVTQDIDIEFPKGNPIWDSASSPWRNDEAALEDIRKAIQERLDRGDDTYVFLSDEDFQMATEALPKDEKPQAQVGARTTASQAKTVKLQ